MSVGESYLLFKPKVDFPEVLFVMVRLSTGATNPKHCCLAYKLSLVLQCIIFTTSSAKNINIFFITLISLLLVVVHWTFRD